MDPTKFKPDPRNYIAPLNAGISTWLFGIATLQTYMYYHSNKDSRGLNFLVAVVWLLSLIHEVSFNSVTYLSAVTYARNPYILLGNAPDLNTAAATMLLSSAVIGLLIQANSVLRLWRFSADKKILVLTVLLVAARFITGVIPTFRQYKSNISTFQFIKENRWLLAACWITGAVTDILVALNFCYHFHQRRTGFKRTSKLLDTLITWFIATGFLNSIAMVLTVVLFLAMDAKNVIWIPVAAINPRLLFISMLAYLNNRTHFQHMHTQTPSVYYDMGGVTTNFGAEDTHRGIDSKTWPARIFGIISTGNTVQTRPRPASDPLVEVQINVVTEIEGEPSAVEKALEIC